MAQAFLNLVILCFLAVQATARPAKYVTLRGLDKVTARVFDIDAEVGKTFRFGTLEIEIHTCDKTPEEEIPECKAFIEIWENKVDETPKRYFSSWMFSSSPSISAMDHPVYDIWISGCKFSKDKIGLKTDSENVDEIKAPTHQNESETITKVGGVQEPSQPRPVN